LKAHDHLCWSFFDGTNKPRGDKSKGIVVPTPIINKDEPDSNDQAENSGVENQGQESKTFSQDEVNEIISKRVNEINAKNSEKTAKAIENALADYERKAKLSEEEKAHEEQERLKSELASKERDLLIRENRAEAREILSEKLMPSIFVDYIVDEDLDKTKENINKFEKVWNEAIAEEVKKKLIGKTPVDPSSRPKPGGDGGKTSTRELLFGKKG
jgi:hypothetical protein